MKGFHFFQIVYAVRSTNQNFSNCWQYPQVSVRFPSGILKTGLNVFIFFSSVWQLAIFYQEAEQYFEMMEWLSSVMNCFSSRDRELGNS
jgi:hypothetical protein